MSQPHRRERLPPKRVADNPFYFSDACLDANAALVRASDDAGCASLLDANFSWLLHHSALSADDGIVLGASSTAQLRQNLRACAASKPLPAALVDVFDGCWERCRETAYPYWRLYSRDMPGREALCRDKPGALIHC